MAIDPLSIGWFAAWWAEGPEFEALGVADGATVQTWPDEIGTNDLAQATAGSRPFYRASVAALNNRPSMDSGTEARFWTKTWTALTQPNTVVFVGYINSQSDGTTYVAYDGTGSGNRHALLSYVTATPDAWWLFSGTGVQVTGGDADSSPHLFIARHSGASSTLKVDGTQVAAGDSGAHTLTGLTVGAAWNATLPWLGHIAFVGLHDGTLTAQEEADLVFWYEQHYLGLHIQTGTAAGAATSSGTAEGTVTSGAAEVTGTAAGSAIGGGSSAATVEHSATGAGAGAGSGVASATPGHPATAAGASTAAAGIAVALVEHDASASGTSTASGTATGSVAEEIFATASGAATSSGTAIGAIEGEEPEPEPEPVRAGGGSRTVEVGQRERIMREDEELILVLAGVD